MSDTTGLAEILLKQSMARSEFLAPLGSIAETCWLIMLRLYSGLPDESQPIDKLASEMCMDQRRMARYLAALTDTNYVRSTVGGYRLEPDTRLAVEKILYSMIQDPLSSLGR